MMLQSPQQSPMVNLPEGIQALFVRSQNEQFNPINAPLAFYVLKNALVTDADDPMGTCIVHVKYPNLIHYRFMSNVDAMNYGLIESMYMNIALKPRNYFTYLRLFFLELDEPYEGFHLSIEPADFSPLEMFKDEDSCYLAASCCKDILIWYSQFFNLFTSRFDKVSDLVYYHTLIHESLTYLFKCAGYTLK